MNRTRSIGLALVIVSTVAGFRMNGQEADLSSAGQSNQEMGIEVPLSAVQPANTPELKAIEEKKEPLAAQGQMSIAVANVAESKVVEKKEQPVGTPIVSLPQESSTQVALPKVEEKKESVVGGVQKSTTTKIPTGPTIGIKEKKEAKVAEEDQPVGIDTVDLESPQGNWLYKRAWWERSEAKYEKLRVVVGEIFNLRITFFDKQAALAKQVIEPFFVKIGFTRGELNELLDLLLSEIEKEEKEQGALDEQERALRSALQEKKDALLQIKNEIPVVEALVNELGHALKKVMDTLGQAQAYEQEAWTAFKEIARVLNDKQARALFYRIDFAWRNLNELKKYLEQPFNAYFDELLAKITQHVDHINKTIEGLQASGLDLKKKADQLLRKPSAEQENEEKKLLREKLQKEMEEHEAEEENPGFLQNYIISPLVSTGSWLWNSAVWLVMMPFSYFSSSTTTDNEEAEEETADEKEEQDMVEKELTIAAPAPTASARRSLIQQAVGRAFEREAGQSGK